ncbi:MAG: hypothetical protein E7270_07205 [Lachnospiraceae bacterium]|nr:hypothetical protein [Lachnospiraceae bacterium]MBQ4067826.1 hypothetical protein [Lachnospiraceae bacterium]
MRNKDYRFTNKRYAKEGIISSILGVLSVVCLITGIFRSFEARGNGDSIVGLLGMGALLMSLTGLIFGIKSFKDEDKFYTFSKLGIFICGFILICMISILFGGLI